MANWCSNSVQFTGKPSDLKNCKKFLDKMMQNTESGVKHPLRDNVIDGYYFDLYCFDFDETNPTDLSITFESRWGPIVNDVIYMALLHKLDFTYGYEESGMALYGEYQFTNKVLTERCVTNDEWNSVQKEDEYGDHYETDYDALDEIISTKTPEVMTYELQNEFVS